MYHKFLFVGLGGSGYKTLCCLRDQLRGWQRDNGISDPLPKGWQWWRPRFGVIAGGVQVPWGHVRPRV